jgi:methylthioribose-1-phosphate isomerase
MASVLLPKTRAFIWKKTSARHQALARRSSGGTLLLLDQRLLPNRILWRTCRTWQDVAKGIHDMVVRGAPAIGCVAAYGMVLAARQKQLEKGFDGLLKARPTAVNLRWALERMRHLSREGGNLEKEALRIEEEDREANRRMGEFGASLVAQDATLMTHCNTGSLATAGLGTAFGVIWTVCRQGKLKKVIATETRPYLQGARLTAWELKNERIPFELITDSMAAHFMKTEKIDAIFVGADRIAANGDTANKIGTYSLAVLAAHHHVPFYIAAPMSTVDFSTPDGKAIPIEERSVEEVVTIGGRRMAPKGTKARHPAFDVTPAVLISGIVTERGVAGRPYITSLHALAHQEHSLPQRERVTAEAIPL